MKLQFSLAALLVCMTVLAVVCAISVAIPIHEKLKTASILYSGVVYEWEESTRSPNAAELLRRMLFGGPAAIAGTLGVPSTFRRLKSRRHTEPPIG